MPPDKELKEWVKTAREGGADNNTIKNTLLQAGYDEKTAAKAIQKTKWPLWIAISVCLIAIILITWSYTYTPKPLTTEEFYKELIPMLSKPEANECKDLARGLPEDEQETAIANCAELMAVKNNNLELCEYSTKESICRDNTASTLGRTDDCNSNGCIIKSKDKTAISERDATKCATETCAETIAIITKNTKLCVSEQCVATITNSNECQEECNYILAIINKDENYCAKTSNPAKCTGIISALTKNNMCAKYYIRDLQECEENYEPTTEYAKAKRVAYGINEEQEIHYEVTKIIYKEKYSG